MPIRGHRTISSLGATAGLLAVIASGCAASEPVDGLGSRAAHPALTIYSPAAPPNMLWSINEAIGATLAACAVAGEVETVAVALPDAINSIGTMPDRAGHLAIVTTADFLPAVRGEGPDWHGYVRAHDDLKFVASLYEVGIGMMVFDEAIRTPADLKGKRIAVPRRPSSLRVMAEAVLHDAWGLLDEVTLVDLPPHAVAEAAKAGRIDATTWNLMTETPDGFRPLLPDLSKMGRWLSVSAGDIERINAGNTFTTEAVTVAGARLLSFRQALSAWSATADAQVVAILHCLGAAPATAMGDWPGLRDIWVHPAALKFYRRSDPAYLQTRHPGALEARITEQERTEDEP